MAIAVETQYKDLLNPIKDIEKSFGINIGELLDAFINEMLSGKGKATFNHAALLLQGSASVYGKKVEYLYKLAEHLHQSLFSQENLEKKDQQQPAKERKKKEDKFNDPFLSVEFKVGKNLSCLRKKNLPKTAAKKPCKKIKAVCNPVHLLANDNDDKGEVFYDTKGDIVGNKTDFALNKCRLLSSGWLLLPGVNPNLIPAETADYNDDSDNPPCVANDSDIQPEDPMQIELPSDGIESTPDDGFGSYPPSSEVQSSEVPTSEINSETPCSSNAPPSTDEGIGSAADEDNIIPPDEAVDDSSSSDVEMPVLFDTGAKRKKNLKDRKSTCRTPKTFQWPIEDDHLAGLDIVKELLVRRKIEKKNTRRLPRRLKSNSEVDPHAASCPISVYCQRTYFALNEKSLHSSLMNFDTPGLDQNSDLVGRVLDKIRFLKSVNKKKNIIPIEDEQDNDIEGIENLQQDADTDEDDANDFVPLQDEDIQIERDLELPVPDLDHPDPNNEDHAPPDLDIPEIDDDIDSPDLSHLAQIEGEKLMKEVQYNMKNSEITKRVHEWEKKVKPFLENQVQRGNLDMNLYGAHIIDAFQDNNRKQTMTFREFCRKKEKWEIHRYFMSLLPLANMGNVSIESDRLPDDSDEIYITLLSRKMHHIELENFGHKEGSHS